MHCLEQLENNCCEQCMRNKRIKILYGIPKLKEIKAHLGRNI